MREDSSLPPTSEAPPLQSSLHYAKRRKISEDLNGNHKIGQFNDKADKPQLTRDFPLAAVQNVVDDEKQFQVVDSYISDDKLRSSQNSILSATCKPARKSDKPLETPTDSFRLGFRPRKLQLTLRPPLQKAKKTAMKEVVKKTVPRVVRMPNSNKSGTREINGKRSSRDRAHSQRNGSETDLDLDLSQRPRSRHGTPSYTGGGRKFTLNEQDLKQKSKIIRLKSHLPTSAHSVRDAYKPTSAKKYRDEGSKTSSLNSSIIRTEIPISHGVNDVVQARRKSRGGGKPIGTDTHFTIDGVTMSPSVPRSTETSLIPKVVPEREEKHRSQVIGPQSSSNLSSSHPPPVDHSSFSSPTGPNRCGYGLDGARDTESNASASSFVSISASRLAGARTSTRIRKPTAKALESLQQKPKARRRKTDAIKSQSMIIEEPTISGNEKPEHHSTPAVSYKHPSMIAVPEPEPNLSTEPSRAFPSQFKTETEFLANQLFHLAAAALTPDSELSPERDIDIHQLREEFYTSHQVTDQADYSVTGGPESNSLVSGEIIRDNGIDGGPTNDSHANYNAEVDGSVKTYSTINNSTNNNLINKSHAEDISPNDSSADVSSLFDHPSMPRPWVDDDGWTHTGETNNFGEEIVLVPNTYVWVRPDETNWNSQLFRPASRLKTQEQIVRDRIYGFPPILGKRNLPQGEPRQFAHENVESEIRKIKALQTAAQKGLAADRSLPLADIEAKIRGHDNPGSSKQRPACVRLVFVDSKTGERRDSGASSRETRRRRRTEPAAPKADRKAKNIAKSGKRRITGAVVESPSERSPIDGSPRKKRPPEIYSIGDSKENAPGNSKKATTQKKNLADKNKSHTTNTSKLSRGNDLATVTGNSLAHQDKFEIGESAGASKRSRRSTSTVTPLIPCQTPTAGNSRRESLSMARPNIIPSPDSSENSRDRIVIA